MQHSGPPVKTEFLLPQAAKVYFQMTAQVQILQEFFSANESLLIKDYALAQVQASPNDWLMWEYKDLSLKNPSSFRAAINNHRIVQSKESISYTYTFQLTWYSTRQGLSVIYMSYHKIIFLLCI